MIKGLLRLIFRRKPRQERAERAVEDIENFAERIKNRSKSTSDQDK